MSNNNNGVLIRIRKSRSFKGLSICLALNILAQLIQPSISLALTEGPSQPEVQSFEPIGTTQMVDLFTGDFNYNIPLINIPGPNGGYPINLAYHAGVTMDDEASWVGLGWNLNVGSLVRNMRGLPDEFLSKSDEFGNSNINFDHLNVQSDIKESWTLAGSFGLSTELVGGNAFPDFALQVSAYYNNFRGMGVTLAPSIGIGENNDFSLGLSIDSENGLGINGNIGSSKSENKIIHGNYKYNGVGFSLGFDGDLSLNFSMSSSEADFYIGSVARFKQKRGESTMRSSSSSSISSGISFSNVAYSPHIGREYDYFNASVSLDLGNSATSFFDGLKGISFSFNTQDYKAIDKNGRVVPVVGFDRQGSSVDANYTRDFSRQNDGVATKESVMLGHSYGAYDTYLSTGQGLAGYFRPRRHDIGKYHDPYVYQESAGASVGFDYVQATTGAGSLQFSGEIGVNVGWSTSGPWSGASNDLDDDFNSVENYGIDENLYYQAHGEPTIKLDSDISYMGGLELSEVRLQAQNNDGLVGAKRAVNTSVNFDNDGKDLSKRTVRNTLIHEFLNNEVELLGEFDINYFDKPSTSDLYSQPTSPLDRESRNISGENIDVNIGTHKAGFKVLNSEGAYYVYGLPAYNKKEVENIFSVDSKAEGYDENTNLVTVPTAASEVDYKHSGTHKFISKTTTSPYAHSYLLTSVLGSDYVDRENDGPSDDDLGYWVKFDYGKESDDYQWRAPYDYTKAQFHQGQTFFSDDDKASYKYGEKELWYLARIETKTHIAVFITESRDDNAEALGEHTGIGNTSNGDNGLRLKEIRMYEKNNFSESSVPVQTVHFEYGNVGVGEQLCEGAPNASFGKLTLKSVYFTSMGSTRGELSKYEFDYAGIDISGTGIDSQNEINPSYSENSYNGWGAYKNVNSNTSFEFYSRFPYVNQFNQEWDDGLGYNSTTDLDETEQTRAKTQQIADRGASAWCLNRIKLPSGGVISVDYESDDYGYVQHKTANQMFKITQVGEYSTDPNEIYTTTIGNDRYYNESSRSDEKNRRVYFKLEYPFNGSVNDNAKHVYEKYVKPLIKDEEGKRNLYFKIKSELIEGEVEDFVQGYVPLEEPLFEEETSNDDLDYNYGILDGKYGFVTIQAVKKKKGDDYFRSYHPFALRAWTYLQTNAKQLLHNPNSFSSDPTATTWPGYIIDMLNVIPQLMSSFGSIRSYCHSKDMARYIDLNKSCIRLASPDKRKFGGGHRVKRISISDEWNKDSSEPENMTYGQVYDYTIYENDELISSGVATFEPTAIADENALRYPIHFYGKSSVFSRNNLFSEAPTNADLFPKASVGYRKVTVKSLNTYNREKEFEANNNSGDFGRTGGAVVHEFYTAKDYPTIVSYTRLSEQNNTKDVFNVNIPIPFVGSVKRNYFHGTQAYMIETNDMHGKLKSVKSYELNNYKVNSAPIKESEYIYQSEHIVYQDEFVQKLNNIVPVILPDNPTLADAMDGETRRLGVDVELYTDQRQSKTFSSLMGLDFGFETPTFWPAFPWPEAWPAYTNSKSLYRSFVTNKIIHRSGILVKTKTRDLQSSEESEILSFDGKSGVPIKVKSVNQFGDEMFSYTIPAYYHYERMGHAYQNINYRTVVEGVVITPAPSGGSYLKFQPGGSIFSNVFDHLVRGDELLLTGAWLTLRGPYADSGQDLFTKAITGGHKKGYYLGCEYSGGNQVTGIIHFPDGISINDVDGTWSDGSTISTPKLSDLNPELKVIRSGYRNHYGLTASTYNTRGDLSFGNVTSLFNSQTGVSLSTPTIEDNVLSASASVFRDDWSTSASLDASTFNGSTENPFLSGNSGIWRPYKSYSYVGERSSSADMYNNTTTNDPNLRVDGVMSDVPMFSWEIGNMDEYIPEWQWTSEITRYSRDGYELESISRLGLNSSALFGYDNSLSIAVGGNASLHEIGVYDFEMSINSSFDKLLGQTNMNFAEHGSGSAILSEQYSIRNAVMQTNNELVVTLNIPYGSGFSLVGLETNVGLALQSESVATFSGKKGFYFNGIIDPNGTISDNNGYVQFIVKPYIENSNQTNNMLPNGGVYYGKIHTLESRSYSEVPTLTFSNERAHTGQRSLEISNNLSFEQPLLKLISGKKYILSMWISKTNSNVPTFEPGKQGNSLQEIVDVTASSGNITVDDAVYGQIVEGWQKVDFTLFATTADSKFRVSFYPQGEEALFVDDIRFSPSSGGITTYVYDNQNFLLSASLNVENYATLFFYNNKRELELKKQETEKGIFTIKESRSHVFEKD